VSRRPPPQLDTRDLDAIMVRLQELATERLPEWRPPPDGDAGTMLQRSFARLLELALQRLNQAPEKTFLAFLETMGVSLLPPSPARVPLTFTLAPGSPPTLVPAGTQAATRPSGEQPAVTFQTGAALTIVPVRLVAARTVDPVADRFTDHTAALTGQPFGFAPFTGTLRLPHTLWFGGGSLLDHDREVEVEVVFRFDSRRPSEEVTRWFDGLAFEYRSGGVLRTAVPGNVFAEPAFEVVTMTLTVAPVDAETVDAPGLEAPVTSRWLRTRLATPLPLDPVAGDLNVGLAMISRGGVGVPLEVVLAGATPVDASKDFQPFGELPRVGDTLYLGSDAAFGRPGATVWITFTAAGVGESKDLELVWEYLGEDGWTQLEVVAPDDFDFTHDATVLVTQMPALPRARVAGRESRWIRVRIAAGGYGSPFEWVPDGGGGVKPKDNTGKLSPPRTRSITLMYTASVNSAVLRQTGAVFSDHTAAAADDERFPAYLSAAAVTPAALADPEPAWYLGFDTVHPEQPVTLHVAAAPQAFSGRVIKRPPVGPAPPSEVASVDWEYFDGAAWRPLTVLDGTRHLTGSGGVRFLFPADMAPLAKFEPVARYWIRARSPRTGPSDPRRAEGVFLNTVEAVQAATVPQEVLGSGNGQPGQRFGFAQPPVLPGQEVWVREVEPPSGAERTAVEDEEGAGAVWDRADPVTSRVETWVRWHEVVNFVTSGPSSRHYTLDHTSGLVETGDGRCGLIPPIGNDNLIARYRTGGGPAGNVPAGAVGQLLTPLPAVAAVTNPLAADGGAAAETLAQVSARGPQALRHRQRAIAQGDFEWLARQAAGTRVARAVCLPNINRELRFEPGWVTVVVVPADDAPGPRPGAELVGAVEGFLRRLASVGLVQELPSRINVVGPGYLRIMVDAEVAPRDIAEADTVKQRVTDALARFLHPLTGGRGDGWELGRDVYASEVAQVVEDVPGVSYVRSLRLLPSAVQRRLVLGGGSAPIAETGAAAGGAVATVDGRKAALLGEPVAAATQVGTLTVRGLQEQDRITYLLDLEVTEPPQPGGTTIVGTPVAGSGRGGFPRGSPVMDADGRQTLLADPVPRIMAGDQAGPLTIEVTDAGFADGLVPHSRITLFGPRPMTVASVAAEPVPTGPDGRPALDVRVAPHHTDVTYPAGTVLGTIDGRVRLPLAALATPDPATATITALRLHDFQAGEVVELRTGGATSLSAPVAQVRAVEDLVYLDSNIFPYVAGHRIRMVGR
jgi:hypothetical protein